MASVIEDAETYQQSGLIVPPYSLDSNNSDLVPLTNPAASSDFISVRRTSSLGNISRCTFVLLAIFYSLSYLSFPLVVFCSWNRHTEHHLFDRQCCPWSWTLKLSEGIWPGWWGGGCSDCSVASRGFCHSVTPCIGQMFRLQYCRNCASKNMLIYVLS